MKKQISYFDPRVTERDPSGEFITVTADNQEEMDAHMAIITNPSRGITDIGEWETVPPTTDELMAQMDDIDMKLIRPMAAIIDETAIEDDKQIFEELMNQKGAIREQLRVLTAVPVAKKKKKNTDGYTKV